MFFFLSKICTDKGHIQILESIYLMIFIHTILCICFCMKTAKPFFNPLKSRLVKKKHES